MELDVKVILKQLLFIQVYVLFCNDTIWMFFVDRAVIFWNIIWKCSH
jgi:hypothetical protein